MKDTIIIHCSATRAGQDFTATDIDRWLLSTERIARVGTIGLSASATLADWTGTAGLLTHGRKRNVKHSSGW